MRWSYIIDLLYQGDCSKVVDEFANSIDMIFSDSLCFFSKGLKICAKTKDTNLYWGKEALLLVLRKCGLIFGYTGNF